MARRHAALAERTALLTRRAALLAARRALLAERQALLMHLRRQLDASAIPTRPLRSSPPPAA